MKKRVIFSSLVVILTLILAACGSAPAPTTAPPAESSGGSNAAAPTEAATTTAPTEAPAAAPASSQAMEPQRGGSMVIVYKDDLATLDPAVGYDWTNWPAIKMVFDGLLDYDDTTNVTPRLAESMPEVSADGTVYTFKLRQGVKFQNGRELTAADVVYTMNRVLDPKTGSPGAGFYVGIKGAQDFIDGKATAAEGIKAPDKYTVEFTLSQPDVTFLNKMALNFAFIVPKEEVEKAGENFGHAPVGTGPFKFKEWQPGQYLTFERNPDYFYEGLPYLDQVRIEVGVEPDVALLRLEKGEINLMGDPPPGADWARISADAAWTNRIERQPQVSTIYIAINTTVAPFDNLKVRQALNYAIDKQRIVQLSNGRGTTADQILPPLMPGFDSNYKGYEYDPDKAKALLAEAGFPDGFETSIECISVDPQPKLCESFQQDLAKIGVKLTINTLAAPNVIDDAGNGKTPLTWSGGLAWIQDYPDPDDFYAPILGCDSNVPGGWNWSRYCNKDLHADSLKLLALTDRTQRMEGYKPLFKALMDDAVWVPVFNGEYTFAHSDNFHGQPTISHPEHSIRYETMWLAK
ncbi:MAG: ABC transporter substrate-binding protein [Chloroflexi bacterium]|nr:ABC transporter substrate-binding protein [Chloroflexota bacterium]